MMTAMPSVSGVAVLMACKSLLDDMRVAHIVFAEEDLEGRPTGVLCLFERRPAAEEVAEHHGVFVLKPLHGFGKHFFTGQVSALVEHLFDIDVTKFQR